MAGKQLRAGWARKFTVGSFYLPHYASVCSTPCPCLLIVVKGLLVKRGRDYLGPINRINTCSAPSDLRCYTQTTSKHKLASDYWGKSLWDHLLCSSSESSSIESDHYGREPPQSATLTLIKFNKVYPDVPHIPLFLFVSSWFAKRY